MSGMNRFPNLPQNKNRLQQNFFQVASNSRGRFPGSSGNPHFPRADPPVPVNTHDPNERMGGWFPKNEHVPERRGPSMPEKSWAHYSTSEASAGVSNFGEDVWESDFSDDFISQIMNDAFEEKLMKLTQGTQMAQKGPSSAECSSTSNANKKAKSSDHVLEKSGIKTNDVVNTTRQKSSTAAITVSSSRNFTEGSKSSFHRTLSGNYKSSQSSSSLSILSESQRKLSKPTGSFTQSNSSQVHTTEWLRSQLDKVTKENNTLKEATATKDGESKILREKLNDAQMTIEKQKLDKEIECVRIRVELEEQIKTLKKELQSANTKILFKSKEIESNQERYKELKKINVLEPEFSQSFSPSQSFKMLGKINDKFKTPNETTINSESASSSLLPSVTAKTTQAHTQTENNMAPRSSSSQLDYSFICGSRPNHLGFILSQLISPQIFNDAKPEYSTIVPPSMEYYGYDILFRDVSEIPDDDNDDADVIENLVKLWDLENPPEIKKKPKDSIRRKRNFTSLTEIQSDILELIKLSSFEDSPIVLSIINHVTKMARELYIAFRDYDVSRSRKIPERELEILFDSANIFELESNIDVFSPKKWRKERYVDLRRGVALISVLCDFDPSVQYTVLRDSHFIILDETSSRLTIESFSLEEMNKITCVTDSFTNDFDKPSTFLHHGAEELHCLRRSKIVNMDKPLFFPSDNEIDISPNIMSDNTDNYLNELKSLSSELRASLKTKPKSKYNVSVPTTKPVKKNIDNKSFHLHDKISVFIDTLNHKINESLIEASKDESNRTDSQPKPPVRDKIDDNTSVINVLTAKEHDRWKSIERIQVSKTPIPETRSALIKVSAVECLSEEEKRILNSGFRSFLQIKEAIEREEFPYLQEEVDANIKSSHSKFAMDIGTDDGEIPEQRKRKISSVASDSSSKIFSVVVESGRKRDIAPLKKQKKNEDNENMNTQEIEDELNKMYPKDGSNRQEENVSLIESGFNKRDPQCVRSDNYEAKEAIISDNNKQGECDFLYPEEIAVQCELLEILLEIVRQIGYLRYTLQFSALLSVTLELLRSVTKPRASMNHKLRVENVVSFILEVIYCRPSLLVLLKIHILLSQCISINGFSRLLCTNAHPEKYVVKSSRVEFKRGACLLGLLCTVTDFFVLDGNWDIQYQFFCWTSQLFLSEKTTVTRLYQRQKTTSGRCSCVRCINNCIIRLLTGSVVSFYDFSKQGKLSQSMKTQLSTIMKQGIRILSVIVDIDQFFAQNIPTQYESFVSFLETVKLFHSLNEFDFNLSEYDLKTVNLLLKEESIAKQIKKKHVKGRDVQSMSGTFASIRTDIRSGIFTEKKGSKR